MPGKDLVPLAPAAVMPPGQPSAAGGVPWPEQSARQSEAAIVTIARFVKRHNHVTVPLGILPAMWLAGAAAHQAHVFRYVAFCGLVLAVCVWFFAPHKWTDGKGEPRAKEVWYARLSIVAGVAWLSAAAALGPLSGTVPAAVLASLLAAGCIAWGIPWFWHKRPRGMKRQQRLIAQCDAWWQSHCWNWNLAGSRATDAELSGVTLRIRLRGLPGRHTLQHFRQAIPFIESAAEGQADIGLVRIEPVKGKPCEVDLFLKQHNPLRDTVAYDPEIAPQSIHDPAPFGRKETADWKMVRYRANRFTIGMTRWGKSNDLLLGVANMSGCPDARFILVDLKGGRSSRPVLKSGAAEYVITEVDEARMYLRMVTAEAKAREMYAYDGNEQLHATTAVPALFTIVDETHGLTATEDGAGDPECRRLVAVLASQGSGVEEYVWIYTQHGSLETSVGTEQIRGNLPWRTCYRVAEARHGAYCIEEYNRLDASKLEEKGTCYIKDGPEITPEQIRTPLMEHDLVARIAAQNAALLGPRQPLRLYCGDQIAYQTEDGPVTWQQWWDARWLRLHKAFHADSPQYQAAAAAAGPQDSPPSGQVPPPSPGAAEAAATAARLTPGIVAPDDFRPDPALVKQLGKVLATQEDRFCDALEAATAGSPATPKGLESASGMGRSWVFDRLGALAEIGMVTQVSRGRYAVVPGSDVRAGLREIKDRNDRLAREARDLINAQ